ncbi:MAG TPA: serine dehydratase subunit alpha family protein [Candidatus Faecivivens stercoravium]|uniref:UPF0597 protein IAB37_02260 n=1 Tax=Candidatus Faecivivens stercoravium TaxID=2840803 RepID=A0A9D1J4H5_9FIRM|nr:serine dehydratase subunit alpha family protein [Candidatus Faecivivens stercoravium]
MNQQQIDRYIRLIRSETAPAMGCTEPAAGALCAAAAAAQLGCAPESLTVEVSSYIFKNAMNVGIPGTGETGLDIACAMGALCPKPELGLSVLGEFDPGLLPEARRLARNTRISVAEGVPKVYIRAVAHGGGSYGEAVIRDTHTGIVYLGRDGVPAMEKDMQSASSAPESGGEGAQLDIPGIWQFGQEVPVSALYFLRELVQVNCAMAEEGLSHPYGLQVGRQMHSGTAAGLIAEDTANFAAAYTAAAADARMSGCEQAVMSVAGSGNQGLTATLPVIAVARKSGKSEEVMLRALAISILTTIHAKEYIGRLSVLCGCGVASSIGVTAGVVYMLGGSLEQAEMGIRTMTADISGIVCDGAKPGCALKIATSVGAAMRAASFALSGIGASAHDGIVAGDVEETLRNLGELGADGMAAANQVILDMLLHKQG